MISQANGKFKELIGVHAEKVNDLYSVVNNFTDRYILLDFKSKITNESDLETDWGHFEHV